MNNVGYNLFDLQPKLIRESKEVIYDIKVLYSLEGKNQESLTSLASMALNTEDVRRYNNLSKKFNAFLKSFKISNIEWKNYELKKIIPNSLFEDIELERKSLLLKLLEKSQEKEFYKKFYTTLQTLLDISSKPLFIDLSALNGDDSHYSKLLRKNTIDGKLYLHFNPVGAKTGRLSFKHNTVNFYILPKYLRKCLVAPEDYNIVQLDYKSFQPRLAIFSTDSEDFKNVFNDVDDIYSIFPGNREENKISFISWMFSQRRHSTFDEQAFPILDLRKKLYSDSQLCDKLTTNFGRSIYYNEEEENVVFQNFITATEVDAILSVVVELSDYLRDRKSRIVLPFHDSIILYIHESEMSLIEDIKKKMEIISIFNAKFPVSIKVGKNFEELFDYNLM